VYLVLVRFYVVLCWKEFAFCLVDMLGSGCVGLFQSQR